MVLSEVPSWPEPKSARGCLAYNPLETSTNHEIQMYSVLIPCVSLSSCFRCDGCYITLTANLIIYYCTWHESTSEVFRTYIMIYDFGSSKQKTSKNNMLVSTLSCLGEAVGLAASLAIASSSDSKVAQASPACSNLALSFSIHVSSA